MKLLVVTSLKEYQKKVAHILDLAGIAVFSGGYGSGYSGGGMYNKYASPTISHCNFSNNIVIFSDGGGMYNEDSSPTISYCTF